MLFPFVVLVFGRSVTYGFLGGDGYGYVAQKSHVLHGLSSEEVAWSFTHFRVGYWLPLLWISYIVDSQLFGFWPGGYHFTNVLLYAVTAIGLFLILRQMTGQLWPSALAATLFAIDPLRAESVAWIMERKDVFSGLFSADDPAGRHVISKMCH